MDVDGRPYNTRGVRRNYAELAGLATRTTNAKVKVALQKLEQAPPDEKDDAMDALAAALKAAGLGMGGRRRTRKGKGKKRGGENPCHDLEEQVKELEEALARVRGQANGGGTRKHPRKTRKTRRGGVEQTPEELAVKKLRAELDDLEKDPSATPDQIAKKRNEFVKALDKERFILRGQRM
jgi:hypothetical protein